MANREVLDFKMVTVAGAGDLRSNLRLGVLSSCVKIESVVLPLTLRSNSDELSIHRNMCHSEKVFQAFQSFLQRGAYGQVAAH